MEQPKKILVKKEVVNNTGGSLGNIYVGDANKNPGVLKAQSDKIASDKIASDYKKNADSIKKKIMVKVLTPQEKRAELQKSAQFKRDEIIKKKDSIIQRNLNATGLTKEQYQAKQASDAKKPNCNLEGMQVGKANKRGETKGSCSTGQSNKGESLKDTK